jgi:DNA-binding LytR/AlgR family response regulator
MAYLSKNFPHVSTIRILAIEDDPLYVESLKIVMEELGYELMAVVDTAEDALHALSKEHPDVILMDIQINDRLSGIELAKLMKPLTAAPIIYVTAFKDRHVIAHAASTSPSAYIIKPYEPESLQAAIELAIFTKPVPDLKQSLPPASSFYIKDNHRLVRINIAEILYVEVEEKYCYISTAQKRHIINMRLKDLLERLPEGDFIQVHRSFVVRKSAIEEVNNTLHEVVLAGKKSFPVGKSFRETLLSSLNYLSKS